MRNKRILLTLLAGAVALVMGTTLWADRGRNGDDDHDYLDADEEEEEPFDVARIFLEYNSNDNDLGVQVFLDGDAWKRLRITDPRGRRILGLAAEGPLGRLGLTELFFESAEPSPQVVLGLIREGTYEFEGVNVAGEDIESEVELSHALPPVPTILVPSAPGAELNPDNAVIRWAPIAGIASIEVIVENEDVGAEMTVPLRADATSLHIPEEFLDPETGYKVEILAIGENGNKTIVEREFVTGF